MKKEIKESSGEHHLVSYNLKYFIKDDKLKVVEISLKNKTECAIIFDEDSQEFKIHIQPFTASYDGFNFDNMFKNVSSLSNYLYGLESEVELTLHDYIEGAKEMVEAVSFLNNEINKLKSEEL